MESLSDSIQLGLLSESDILEVEGLASTCECLFTNISHSLTSVFIHLLRESPRKRLFWILEETLYSNCTQITKTSSAVFVVIIQSTSKLFEALLKYIFFNLDTIQFRGSTRN